MQNYECTFIAQVGQCELNKAKLRDSKYAFINVWQK